MARYRHTARATQPQRRLRYAARRAGWLGIILLIVAGAMLADKQKLFGRRSSPDFPTYNGQSFRVTHVVDGDTFDVEGGGPAGPVGPTRVRLLGVDTPETVKPDTPPQRYGPEASAFLKDLLLGRQVRLELDASQGRTRDKYGRLLAYAHLDDGRCVDELIISLGYGYADPRFRHARLAEYKRVQAVAKAAGVGLWKDITEPELPDYFRKPR